MSIFGFRLPSPGAAYDWLKNWAETYIYNPILTVLSQVKAGVIDAGEWLANVARGASMFFSELKRRFLATLTEGVRRAKELVATATKEITSWVFDRLAALWRALGSMRKEITDWVLGKLDDVGKWIETAKKEITAWVFDRLAALWRTVSSMAKFLSGLDDWFVKKFHEGLDASGAFIYDVLARFIERIW